MFLCRHGEIPERRTSRSTQTGGRESTVHVTGRGGPVLRTACANRRASVGSLRQIAAWMTGGKSSPTTKNFRSARKTKGVPAPKIIRSVADRGPATKNGRSAARLRTTSAGPPDQTADAHPAPGHPRETTGLFQRNLMSCPEVCLLSSGQAQTAILS